MMQQFLTSLGDFFLHKHRLVSYQQKVLLAVAIFLTAGILLGLTITSNNGQGMTSLWNDLGFGIAAPSIRLVTKNSFPGQSGDLVTGNNMPSFEGSARIGSTINVYDGNTLLGKTKTNQLGVWKFTVYIEAALSDGPHKITARAVLSDGRTSNPSRVLNLTILTAAPSIPVINSATVNPNSVPGQVTLKGSALPNTKITIFDGKAGKANSRTGANGEWSITLSDVSEGSHSYRAAATNSLGISSPVSTPATVLVETGSPITQLDASPDRSTNDPNAEFRFSSPDTNTSFQCVLDRDKYAPCTSPLSYTGLSNGTHTFHVRAVNSNGKVDPTPINYSWQIFKVIKVLAAGDIVCGTGSQGSCEQVDTANLLLQNHPDAVFTLGDNQYECGSLQDFKQYYDASWGKVKSITHPAIGNHEYGGAGDPDGSKCSGSQLNGSGYFTYFGAASTPLSPACITACEGYYSYNLGAWHIIVLNSICAYVGGCGQGSPEEIWLKNDLAAHPASCTLAYWHYPRFSSSRSEDKFANGLEAFWQDLYNARVDIVLNGHDHDYERFAPLDVSGNIDRMNGIREFIVGTGGRSHYPIRTLQKGSEAQNSDTSGVLQLTLNSNSYSWQFLPVAGKTFTDSGSSSCH